MGTRRLAISAACSVAALVHAVPAPADPAACVGTGVVATQTSAAAGPAAAGPVLTGPTRSGATLDTGGDPVSGLSVSTLSLGVAGCLDAQETPGGTALRAGAWSVFGGAVRGSSLRADLVPASGDGTGWHLRTTVEGLEVDGHPATLTPGQELPVGTWAELSGASTIEHATPNGLRWWRAALRLRLVHAHAGLPAGAVVLIGWVAADRRPGPLPAVPPPTTTTTTTTGPTTTAAAPRTPQPRPTPRPKAKPKPKPAATPKQHAVPKRPSAPKRHHVKRVKKKPKPTGPQPVKATPPLGNVAYSFPVAGATDWGDSYGGARSDVSDGWHHGDDLFAALGTPVVAVADGIVFSVGWNRVGGWRLWLIDRAGNEFYYAHLSGYTQLGKNNRHVHRGDVLGFVGNTGDAFTTLPHLHFEVHPSPLLYLGYDGAVDPTTYLRRWQQPGHVEVLPPVSLPGSAPSGFGSAVDFRKLLAIRPMKLPRAPGQPKTPTPDADKAPTVSKGAVAAAPVRGPRSDDGSLAAAAGLVIGAIAMLALLYTARAGRRP